MGTLNDKAIRAEKIGYGEKFLADGDGLYLRIRAEGTPKVWFYRYTMGGKARKKQLGVYPSLGLAEARAIAREMTGRRRQGIDPISEIEASKATVIAEQAAAATQPTVNSLFALWERIELKSRKDKGAEARRSFTKDVLPVLGDVFVKDVRRSAIAACLDKVVERGSPNIARNLLGDLRQMFGFAIKREYLENDPTGHLKRDDFCRKVERDRVLNDSEIKLLAEILPDAEMKEANVAALWIMLSTCCRVREIILARWEHVDLNAGTWWIPPGNSKNSKSHTVFLSEFAKVHFQTLRRLVEEAVEDKGNERAAAMSPWLMPASRVEGHVCLKSLSKLVGDRQREDRAPLKHRTKQSRSLELPRGRWRSHDLRRTGATLMGTLGVRPDVIEKCLNHVEPNRLVRIYQRQSLLAEQAEAWRLLGERLELLTSNTTNVVPLKSIPTSVCENPGMVIFFDVEFTNLHWDAELISIGLIAENGVAFYAELTDTYQFEDCSSFVREVVHPLLEGGNTLMTFVELSLRLGKWIESFKQPVKLATDSEEWDWMWIQMIFEAPGKWPSNLLRRPEILFFDADRGDKFNCAREMAFQSGLRRHHSLDDAKANRQGWLAVKLK